MGELTLAVSRLNNEKVMLEQSMEMEEEGIVNRLQRVIETVMARNKVPHSPASEGSGACQGLPTVTPATLATILVSVVPMACTLAQQAGC